MLKSLFDDHLKKYLKEKNSPEYVSNKDAIDAAISTIRLIKARISEEEKKPGAKELDDEAITAILKNFRAKRISNADIFFKAGREDLGNKEMHELSFIEMYLPDYYSEDQTREEIQKIVDSLENPSIGSVMKVVSQFPEFDKKIASRIAKEILNGR